MSRKVQGLCPACTGQDDFLCDMDGLIRLFFFFPSECFCAVTATDIQKKIAMGTGKKRKVPPEERLSVEKVADRFNQVTRRSFI